MSELTLRELRARWAEMGNPDRRLVVHVGPDVVEAMRRLPNFTPVESYRSTAAHPGELGMVEWFHFFGSSDSGWSINQEVPTVASA